MKFPTDKETMQSFLGMINFINWYSPKLADMTDPLHHLCRLHVVFHPTKEAKEAFHQIQQELSKNIQLSYFNSNSDTTLQTDRSTRGLGAVILQLGNPVYFASRALSNAERNYQNVERETLGNIWGMEWFHYFLYRKPFILETDQNSLFSIYRKHMVNISPWVQKLIFRSFPYQPFDMSQARKYHWQMHFPMSLLWPRGKMMVFIYLS